MMTLSNFKSRTDYNSDSNAGAVVRGITNRNRGSNLEVIDAALSSYERALPGANQKAIAAALERVIVACQWWLKKKQSKIGVKTATTNTDTRAIGIRALQTEAQQELANLSMAHAQFATNKANAIEQGTLEMQKGKGSLSKKSEVVGTVGLAQGYGHERQSYLNSKKDFAISGSAVYQKENDHGISYKKYKEVYDTLVREGGISDNHVAYLPKTDRLTYLLVCQNGVFSYPSGANATGSIQSNNAEPYAIDRYGSFFSTQIGTKSTKGQIFNHSCFTAGTPVLCAGMCKFDGNGHLHHIDNDSGHYKPGRLALWKAVNIVISQGVNGAELRVACKDANQVVQHYKGSTFKLSLNAIPDWDDNDNQRLGLI